MKLIALNASGRALGNTGRLLTFAVEDARANGWDAELIHLSRLNFRGCRSCFACKTNHAVDARLCRCFIKDDLSPVLEALKEADVLLLGAPVYFGSLAADAMAFLERLWFPALAYDREMGTLWPKPLKTGLVLTMNVPDAKIYDKLIAQFKTTQEGRIGPVKTLTITDTCQFDDYSKYHVTMFDPAHKSQRGRELETTDKDKILAFLHDLMA